MALTPSNNALDFRETKSSPARTALHVHINCTSTLLRRCVWLDEHLHVNTRLAEVNDSSHLAEGPYLVNTSDLLREKRELYNVESILVQVKRLFQVLLLHLMSHGTLITVVSCMSAALA